jgi:Tfp pilus assembly protein PilV
MTRNGFTALEALLAVAILAIALLPLMEVQRQQIRATERQQAAWNRISAEKNALAVVTEINPKATPTGTLALGDGTTVRWASQPLTKEVLNANYTIGDGAFRVALYRVDVTVMARDNSTMLADFAIERMGWQRIISAEQEQRDSLSGF